MSAKRIGVVGCKHTTLELILGLIEAGFEIAHCVTISPEKGASQEVAGYLDLRPELRRLGVPFTVARRYSLKSAADEAALLALKLDVLLVQGWQRLIPDWWLDALPIGAFGMHGSSRPLPHGRGRSPMNWSLIQGKDRFYTHLFEYLPGVDDGPVVGVQVFDITPYDDCLTLHYKNTLSMLRLATRHLPALLAGTAPRAPQPTEGATYYPQRRPEDGLIDWGQADEVIYNLVRATTRPFPGARSYLDDDPARLITLWRVAPFDRQLTWPSATPGEIVEVFLDGAFVVQAGAGAVIVHDYEGAAFTRADRGRRLGLGGHALKVWSNLPS
ncbi:hypothetical protein KKF91_03315 [Myxococcota bacterium]|nr:hypothetical protein [Myxococcota bacterium]MBU1429571.1 hypothetical protein [Myxococcota bacterium]MBU1900587.1 hypothetical protein [Myxococcota bacterium]